MMLKRTRKHNALTTKGYAIHQLHEDKAGRTKANTSDMGIELGAKAYNSHVYTQIQINDALGANAKQSTTYTHIDKLRNPQKPLGQP